MAQVFANHARARLAQSVGTADTTIAVRDAFGIPLLGAGQWFLATLFIPDSRYASGIEIVKVTGVSGSTWTVQRGQEDTTAIPHDHNLSLIELRVTAGVFNTLYQSFREATNT